jgi:uncharacterized protein (TIGR02186 family)
MNPWLCPAIALTGLMLALSPARAERLIMLLSEHRVLIASNFAGTDLMLFGIVERDATTVRGGGYDIVLTVLGPHQSIVMSRKERVFGIWANVEQRTFLKSPAYLAVLANRPVEAIASPEQLRRLRIGLANVPLGEVMGTAAPGHAAETAAEDPFRQAFLREKSERGLYRERTNGVTFVTPTVFRAAIPLPGDAPIGIYEVEVKLLADGTQLAQERSAFELYKAGVGQVIAHAAHDHAFLYGLSTAVLALMIGWAATVVFRSD